MYRFYEDEQHSFYILDVNGIHISKDTMKTWQRLPVDNRLFLCMLILNKDTLLAGTFEGVVTSVDGGTSWKHHDAGLASLNIASITETRMGDLVVSAGKQIYKSTDQGGHWESKYSSQQLGGVLAIDADGKLYAADRTSIRQSSDNGESWGTVIFTNEGFYATAMAITDAKTTYVGVGDGKIFRFTQGGKYWETVFVDKSGYAIRSLLIDHDGYMLCATANSVFKSRDNGTIWYEIFNSAKGWIVTTVFLSEKYLFAGTYNDGLFRSTDGGATWERTASIPSGDPIIGMARDKNGALIAAGMIDIYKSWDQGTTWISIGKGLPLGTKKNICITTKGELFIGTEWNGIYVSRAIVATVPVSNPVSHFSLAQNYPNPFNPSTTISFSIPSKSQVSLKIYDVMGREVAVLFSETLAQGNYSRQWNASGMASGMYFYRLQAGGFLETKHLMLVK